MRLAACCVAVLALVAACAGGEGDSGERGRSGDRGTPATPPQRALSDEQVIRGWIAALNAADYESAASHFAPGAVVEQVREFRLPDREAAIAFNESLPCRADLTDVEDEGDTTLAAFRLRAGPGGPCSGAARVRFTIRDGKVTEWRQLAEGEEVPPGRAA